MADEQEVIVDEGAAGSGSGEGTPADGGAVDAEVEVDEGAAPAGDETVSADGKPAKPEVNLWEGIPWGHRQAAERAGRDATWAKAVGPDVLDGLKASQDDLSRDWAAGGRQKLAARPEDAPAGGGTPGAVTATEVAAAQAAEFTFDPELVEGYDDDHKQKFFAPLQDRLRKVDAMEQRVARLSAIADRMDQAEQQQQVQRTVELLKGFVNSPEIAAEFSDVYGNGDLSTMKETDPAAQAMGELFINADAIFRRAGELGRPISEKEALTRANSFLQSDRIRASERDKGRKEAEKVRRTATHRPATRTAPPEADDEKKNEAETLSWLKTQTRKLGAAFSR